MANNLSELKQYIQKELNSKKFLTESLGTLNDIESLQNTKAELEAAVEKLKDSHTDESNKLDAIVQTANDAADKVKEHEQTGADIINTATKKAEDIIKTANLNASAITAAAKDELAALKTSIKTYGEQTRKAQEAFNEVTNAVDNIKAEQTKLLNKLTN